MAYSVRQFVQIIEQYLMAKRIVDADKLARAYRLDRAEVEFMSGENRPLVVGWFMKRGYVHVNPHFTNLSPQLTEKQFRFIRSVLEGCKHPVLEARSYGDRLFITACEADCVEFVQWFLDRFVFLKNGRRTTLRYEDAYLKAGDAVKACLERRYPDVIIPCNKRRRLDTSPDANVTPTGRSESRERTDHKSISPSKNWICKDMIYDQQCMVLRNMYSVPQFLEVLVESLMARRITEADQLARMYQLKPAEINNVPHTTDRLVAGWFVKRGFCDITLASSSGDAAKRNPDLNSNPTHKRKRLE